MQMKEVWKSVLDDGYKCVVMSRSDPYQGKLLVFEGEDQIHSEDVMISFGAPHGPEADDVDRWKRRCVDIIDEHQM